MTLHELLRLLPEETAKLISLHDAMDLVLEAEYIKQDLIQDGYEFNTQFSYESILEDLVPEFLVDYGYQLS